MQYVSDGGLETDLIYHHGVDLPHFTAYVLLRDAHGRDLLRQYYEGYAQVAERHGVGLQLETPAWRASSDWGDLLGDDASALAAANADAVALLREIGEQWSDRVPAVRVVGQIGPRGDGYRPGARVDPDEAAEYHRPQVAALARAGADHVEVLTLTDVGEAVGVVRAARDVGMPVWVGWTVEVDGRLPGGTSLQEAVEATDTQAAPDAYMVNCAHPRHVAAGLSGPWDRVRGLKVNASERSHEELDAMTSLDPGDPAELAAAHVELERSLPALEVVGGCCGTDATHVGAIWAARTGGSPPLRR
ncbi:homocysteine S-methyltransferase family protein [Janibacter melonis]|uniref:homocysteine S-methyltransferase family protein n=1 Tax=Janibacter melonis TaxID=262209 RepID=UPI001918F8FF|nr:homocysteine S-methyltransferase family protein [Janibacter melonis]